MKKLVLVISLLFVTSHAVSALPKCSKRSLTISDYKEVPSSWTNCIGKIKFGRKAEGRAGQKYVGEFKDGKRHGQGTYTWVSGRKYVGEYKDDKRHGQGTFTFKNGNKYVGEFKDDKRHGQGTLTGVGEWKGQKYVGEWKDDKRHGQGTYTYKSGSKYVGEWKDGKEHGQATYTWAHGDKYVGEYKEGKQHGQGTYTWAGKWKGQKYVGEWKDSKQYGQGTMTYADGRKYVGEYKEGKQHGQGTYTWADGRKYVGEYKDGKRHEGIETSLDAENNFFPVRKVIKNGLTVLTERNFDFEMIPPSQKFLDKLISDTFLEASPSGNTSYHATSQSRAKFERAWIKASRKLCSSKEFDAFAQKRDWVGYVNSVFMHKGKTELFVIINNYGNTIKAENIPDRFIDLALDFETGKKHQGGRRTLVKFSGYFYRSFKPNECLRQNSSLFSPNVKILDSTFDFKLTKIERIK